MKSKLDDWINKKPIGLDIMDVDVDPCYNKVQTFNHMGPTIVKNGYEGVIKFRCDEW